MKTTKEITIIGATGKLGMPVCLNLAQDGFKVTAIVRDIKKAEKFFGRGNNITLVYGDLTDPASLQSALKTTKFLYLNLSTMTTDINTPFAAEREGIENVLHAVNKDTIQQIITISGLGAFQKDIVPEQFTFPPNTIRSQGHQMLRESGIPYTILHCSWFIDSFIAFQRKGVYSVIGNNDHPIYFTNVHDYSLQLANAIDNPKAFNKDYAMQGEKGVQHVDAAERFLKIYNPKVKVKVMPGAVITMIALFNKELKVLKAMYKYFKHSKEEFQAEVCGTYEDLGKPQLSIEEYAKKLKAAEADC